MPFDRDRLPDPVGYYESLGLKFRERGGKWRTTSCEFHQGSDSMRINTQTGAFVCMAGCGARGGDILAYHMAHTGLDFVEAAKALGAWYEDGKPEKRRRPTPISPRDALEVLSFESTLVAVAASNLGNGAPLNKNDLERVLAAAGRINQIRRFFQ